MSKTAIFLIYYLSVSAMQVYPNEISTGEVDCVPTWAIKTLDQSGQFKELTFSPHMNPFVIEGDFNHDKKMDIAILVRERGTGNKGIAIVHQGQSEFYILGAGHEFGNGGKNWNWMDVWNLDKSHKEKDGIFVSKSESASALILWDGKNYVWEQLGD